MKKNILLSLFVMALAVKSYAQSTTLKLPTADSTSNFKVTNNTNALLLRLNGDNGFYLGGTFGTGVLPVTGTGPWVLWYPAKAAFRAGIVDGTQWDDANIGAYSIALGRNTTASNDVSTAMGYGTTASGQFSTAMGDATNASGEVSTAMGYGPTASGKYSTAMGWYTTASGDYSTALGYFAKATGESSTAIGFYTTAQADESVVLGQYNIVAGQKNNWVGTDPLFVIGNGSDYTAPSNALTVFKNGNMEVEGQIQISGGSPGAGKVLTSDASGFATWAAGTSTFNLDDAYDNGDTITADSGAVFIKGTDGLISTGTFGSGAALSPSGAGTRMIWYPAKAAFRAGSVNGIQWDDDSIGNYSVAMGQSTTASGNNSMAMGYQTSASGQYSTAMGTNTIADAKYSTAMGAGTKAGENSSTAMGYGTTASGTASTAMGAYSVASGIASIVMGEQDTASGDNSTAMGFFTAAHGHYSTAMGSSTKASGGYSTAMGFGTKASGGYSTTMGNSTAASGQASTAMGVSTTAQAYASLVIGQFNVVAGLQNSWVATDPLFVVGNGTSSTAPSNALTVLKNGNTGIGTATPDTTLEVAGLIKITGGSPGTGKVLTSDANGLATWQAPGTSTFNLNNAYDNGDTITADSGPVFINGTDGLISTGTYGSGAALSASGAGTRMIWYPAKAAFRAGYVNGTQWDDANIGNYSTAMGDETTASGEISTAMGYGTLASGQFSTAMGVSTTASGEVSTAMGYDGTASGDYSTVMGYATTASGLYSTAMGMLTTASYDNSTAMGYDTKASGQNSTAMGNQTNASASASTAMGNQTNASGGASTAMGSGTTASGDYSTAMGYNTTASGDYSTAMGSYASTDSHSGSFAIGDNSTTDVVPTANNQMVMRFAGGYRLYTKSDMSVGVSLDAGQSSWAVISDSTKKYAFLPVNGDSVLKKINRFNLRTWSYKGQDSTKFRHYGPMAQEFFAAFGHDKYGVAGNDTTINQADFMGVNLIAIQALYRKTKNLKSEVTKQKQVIAALQKAKEENISLKNKVASLEKALSEQNLKITSQQKFIEKMAGNMTAFSTKLKVLEDNRSGLSYNDKTTK